MATEVTMDMTGQEQIPAERTVPSNTRRSNVWGHFTHFKRRDGKSKAKCKKCNRELAAETRNGTSSLIRHVRSCKRLGRSETDGHKSNQLTGSTSVHASWAWSTSFPSDLPPTPQQQPPFPPLLPPLGEPTRPHGSSERRASGLETADVGAARPPQPMSPSPTTLSLSLPGSSMHDQDEEVLQNMVSGFEQLCNISIDKVQNMGALPIFSVEDEAAGMNVEAAPTPQQQQIPSRSGPAGGGSSDSNSDHDPSGLEEAREHLAQLPRALSVSEESNLEVEEQGQHEPGLEEDEAIIDLAQMIALHGYDSSFVEDDHFRSFVKRLNPELKLPSRATIQCICDGIFDGARRDVFSRLSRAPGRISMAVGAAKAMGTDVVYTACHFIDDEWNLHKELLDAYMVGTFPYNHGPLLGVREACLNLLSYKGFIEDVILDVSKCGIIPNMLFMIARPVNSNEPCEAVDMHEGLSSTCAVTRGLVCYTFVDIVLHSIAQSLSNEIESTIFDVNCDVQTHLHLTRQKREDLLSHLGLNHSLRDYNKFWYSCYCSLQVLRSARVTPATTNTESEFWEVMFKLLDAMYHAIQEISASTTPTSNLCLVELFNLRELLQTEEARASGYQVNTYGITKGNVLKKGYNEFKRDALRAAKDTLDKALRASYLIWSIPLALDPRYKLRYIEFNFQRAFGYEAASNYISEVTKKIEDLYKDYAQDDRATVTLVRGGDDPLQREWDERHTTQAQRDLDRYFNDEPIPPMQGFVILNWWKVNSQSYPTVARMARDALAMPTCSKLSSKQISHVMSIVRGYSNEPFVDEHYKQEEGSTVQ